MILTEQNLSNGEMLIYAGLLIPILAALSSWKIKTPNFREAITILMGIALFLCNLAIYKNIELGNPVSVSFAEIIDGINISFKIDYLGVIFCLLASFLWVITTIYSIGYMRGNDEKNQTRFYSFFALAIFGAMGVAYAGNLLTLFIFYEFLTLSTYPLVTHSGTPEAKASGRKYLGILLATSIGFQLPAIIIVYHLTGSLEFSSTAMLADVVGPVPTGLLLALFAFGIGKTAVMPFHKWLPAAMVAPTPVSALLHAVAVVKAGLFTLLKVIVYVFGVENLDFIVSSGSSSVSWLVWLGAFTTILSSIIALKQDNLKMRLAYSTISQLSYVVMACGLFNYNAIIAGSGHIVFHAFAKITLFFAAGAIYTASKKKYVSELGGLAKRMPITAFCFTIGALSMIGLPPTSGLISKFYLMQAAHTRSEYFVTELIISTALNAGYFLPIIFSMYFSKETVKAKGKYKEHKEAPKAILIAMIITMLFTIGLFIYPDLVINMADKFSHSIESK